MFYVRYLRNELVRRRARTILTLLGLGLGVALVIAISSISSGLDRAQHKTLDPLAGIGTDLTVTLTPNQDQGVGFAGPGGGGGGFGGGQAGRGAFAKCLPASLRKFRTRFTTPQQPLRQVLDPPQTNITTTAYTIGGVDQSKPAMGVVTKAQVTKGRY